MCGIAGILTLDSTPDYDAALAAMRIALRHRGPDDEGTAWVPLPGGGRLGLAHTRLSILDLSPSGHQPMTDPATGSWIVFNGEVYNHQALRQSHGDLKCIGGSDTETMLRLWESIGQRALDEFRGMFAFALWDATRHRFWLVRDRLGVKPLYVYRLNDRTLLFASEVTALLASGLVPRRLYAPAIDSYLAWGCVPSRWSLIEGVECVQPGERWCFDLGGQHETLKPHREYYWRPPFHRTSRKALTRGEAIEQLRPVICKAFELRMVSDVPVGVFLSGGIDSSEIVATLATLGYKLHTFSMVFGERLYDESDHSRAVARRFSSEHTELILKPDDVLENFEHALAAYDQPSIDGLNTYFIARSTRAAGVKVAISGLGGDELFAGYSYFRYTQQLNRPAYRIAARLAHLMLRRIAPQQMRTLKLGAMLQAMGSPLRQYQVCREVMPVNRRRSLYRGHEMTRYALANETAEHLQHQIRGLDPVNAYSLLEIAIYLGGMLLRDTDQMSMANSLEVREPLLDHVLVETVARMPGDMKLQAGEHSPTKGLLVDSLPIDLPDQVANRPKMGFVFPWEDWLRGDLRHRIEATLMDRHAVAAAGLNPQGIEDIWQGYLTHRPGLRYTDILSLLNLLEWVRRHRLVLEDHS